MGWALEFCARHGRWGLVVGLLVGLGLPALAEAMRPWLPPMVAGLLFITAFRIGYRASVGQLSAIPRTTAEVLCLQLALPVLAIALFAVFGWLGALPALAVIVMLSAPSISGAPNFAVMAGHDPAPAMQVLVVGTALFPLTTIPLLLAMGPSLGSSGAAVAGTSLRLIAVILGAAALGFAARAVFLPRPTEAQIRQLDGLGVVALAVIVVGLMAGISPLIQQSWTDLAGWLALVFGANFGLQILTYMALRQRFGDRAVPLSIIAGNRNVALFLLALPPDVVDVLLPFIGCYQLPMYLTPLLLGRLYQRRDAIP